MLNISSTCLPFTITQLGFAKDVDFMMDFITRCTPMKDHQHHTFYSRSYYSTKTTEKQKPRPRVITEQG